MEKKHDSIVHNKDTLKVFRKDLRKKLTPAEARLWTMLKNGQLGGVKFRRQHSVGNYILDFYCTSHKLAIELDGQVHASLAAQDYDDKRTAYLESQGIKVLRFENDVVFKHADWLLEVIKDNVGL